MCKRLTNIFNETSKPSFFCCLPIITIGVVDYKGNGDVVSHMTPDMILDYLGILVDTTKVPDLSFTANIILPEGNYVLRVKNGVLLYQKDTQDADADVTWTTKRAGLLSIVQKNAENVAALIQQEGDETCLTRLMDAVTVTSEYKYFNIIEP